MQKKTDYTKVPDREKEPYSYGLWKKLDILTASPLERLLMLELYSLFSFRQWFFNEEKQVWDYRDMRDFVGDVTQKIEKLTF